MRLSTLLVFFVASLTLTLWSPAPAHSQTPAGKPDVAKKTDPIGEGCTHAVSIVGKTEGWNDPVEVKKNIDECQAELRQVPREVGEAVGTCMVNTKTPEEVLSCLDQLDGLDETGAEGVPTEKSAKKKAKRPVLLPLAPITEITLDGCRAACERLLILVMVQLEGTAAPTKDDSESCAGDCLTETTLNELNCVLKATTIEDLDNCSGAE